MIRKIIEAKGLEKIVRLNENELTILKGINLDINQSESLRYSGHLWIWKNYTFELVSGT